MSELTKNHPDFTEMESRWALCEDFAEGEHEVHKAGEKYLPRLTEETDDAYKLRLRMTPVFGAFWRTVVGLQGMLFRKPPEVELPASLMALQDDIDCAGTTIFGLAQEVVENALIVGRIGLLVDHPVVPDGLTKADAIALKLRPLISIYEAKSIYNWRETRVNGVTTLTQVRLIEEIEKQNAEDEFKITCEKNYRVLDLLNGVYRQRVFRIADDGSEVQVGTDIFPKMNNAPMAYIPMVIFGVDCLGPDVDAPPLVDLATTCLHHYMQATSYERGCFFSGLPTMFISGSEDTDKDISIGGPVANALGNPAAKAYYVEVASKFEALRQNLEDKKKEMSVLGARMLEGGKSSGGGVEAAETVARRQSGEEAVLTSMAQTISQGLETALGWMADWLGTPAKITYKLNRDFLPVTLPMAEITALVAAWQQGGVSEQAKFDYLDRHEFYNEGTTFEIEQERINSAQATLMAQQQAQQASDQQMQLDFMAKQVAQNQPTQGTAA